MRVLRAPLHRPLPPSCVCTSISPYEQRKRACHKFSFHSLPGPARVPLACQCSPLRVTRVARCRELMTGIGVPCLSRPHAAVTVPVAARRRDLGRPRSGCVRTNRCCAGARRETGTQGGGACRCASVRMAEANMPAPALSSEWAETGAAQAVRPVISSTADAARKLRRFMVAFLASVVTCVRQDDEAAEGIVRQPQAPRWERAAPLLWLRSTRQLRRAENVGPPGQGVPACERGVRLRRPPLSPICASSHSVVPIGISV